MKVTGSAGSPTGERYSAADAQPATDPWERYGWIMSSIWLVFLLFPLVAAAAAPVNVVWRGLTIAAIAAFGAIYVWGFVRISKFPDERGPLGIKLFVPLTLIALGVTPVIDWNALGLVPFLVAFSSFFFARRTGVLVIVAGLALCALGIALVGPQVWIFPGIILMVGIFTQLTSALDKKQSQERELSTQMTLSNERDRVARDVHDVLGHSLTAITVKAELAQRLIDIDPERARAEMAQVQELSRAALGEVRTTVGGLRAARLDDEITTAQVVLADAGIAPAVEGTVSSVDPRHRTVMAWVLREAVTNVVRHSRASSCTIALESSSLSVVDDGRGVNGYRLGNGIRGLTERVEASGGHLDLGPGPTGTGTALEVQL